MRKVLLTVAAIALASASAAAGWFGVRAWQSSQEASAPAPAAEPTIDTSGETVSLTYRRSDVVDSVDGLFMPPECGQTWTPPTDEANGVLPKVEASLRQTDGVDTVTVAPGYTTDLEGIGFLASEGSVIVTRDDVVVTPEWGADFVPEYYVALGGETTLTQNNVTFTGTTLCDVSEQLNEIWDDFDWANATDEALQEAQRATDEFNARHASLPPGEYKVYQWSPIILGEPAAISRVLASEGVTGLANLEFTIGYSPLADDPRISEYCQEAVDADGNVTSRPCDVPEDVLAEILTRDVPVEFIADVPPAIAFSLADSFTIE